MGSLKIKNNNGEDWKVLSSNNSKGISVTNQNLLEEGINYTSVDDVLERHEEDIDKLKRNVSWLAKHGGGGSGGSGGSTVTEATCKITVNEKENGSQIILTNSGLSIKLNDIDVKITGNWKVSISIGSTQIYTGSASFVNPTILLSANKIYDNLTNHTGLLHVTATYEDENKGIYGSASWDGTVVESNVEISVDNQDYTYEDLVGKELSIRYSSGVIGSYTLTIEAYKDNNKINSITEKINITTSSSSTINKIVTDLIKSSDAASTVGVYTLKFYLTNDNNTEVSGETSCNITIVSDEILIATTYMSEDISNPTEVSLDSTINTRFTAYLSGASFYSYTYSIDDINLLTSTGTFGEENIDFLSIKSLDLNVDDIKALKLSIKSGDNIATKTWYIKFVQAKNTLLTLDNSINAENIFHFDNTQYSEGVQDIENILSTGLVKTNLNLHYSNSLCGMRTNQTTRLPYYRISNGCYGTLGPWILNDVEYNTFNLFNRKREFTISICFKADYHPDDNRTIFFMGSTSSSSGEEGNIIKGISIDVHDIYINNESVAKLTDDTVNIVDIVCRQTEYKTMVGDELQTINGYIIKVYIDGVMTSVKEYSTYIFDNTIFNNIYLGGRPYSGKDKDEIAYLCDCSIYSLDIYTTVLDEYDIMIKYINNQVISKYVDGAPNYDIIGEQLRYNFCSRNSDGTVNSLLYNKAIGSYDISFLLSGNNLDINKLNTNAKEIGLPIMLIDVSNIPDWTFNNFVQLQSDDSRKLADADNVPIQYYDPNGSNSSVVKISGCTIALQGTSTLKDAVKNINITVPNDSVFIPKDTWFPEQTYTLKADVVDSSHSNNAAIGNFINTEFGTDVLDKNNLMPFDNTAISNVNESNYKKTQQPKVTLKHTVEGFPILLIMCFNTTDIGQISVTPLGIYSFNLGRNAYRNLGFKKLDSITVKDSTEKIEIGTYPFSMNNVQYNETDSDANWLEVGATASVPQLLNITENNVLPDNLDSSRGDLWQSDDTVLDARFEVRYPSNKNAHDYQNFKDLTNIISQMPIEPNLYTTEKGNITSVDMSSGKGVMEYKYDSTSEAFVEKGSRYNFYTDPNAMPPIEDIPLSFPSAFSYFVVAMLFGLVDNFGKNQTYRSWNGGKYYIDFYDLDTALGGSNQGALDIGADTWTKYLYNNIIKGKTYGYLAESFKQPATLTEDNQPTGIYSSSNVISVNSNKLWLSIDSYYVRRAYGSDSTSNYSQYWSNLREFLYNKAKSKGYSTFSDYFIEEYYKKQTKQCGCLLFNYDYRLKYLMQFDNKEDYSKTSFLSKLHGRKIEYCRDWLKKHIMFLDTVFHWRSSVIYNFPNDVSSVLNNNTYSVTEYFPMKVNKPLVVYSGLGDEVKSFYFMPRNTAININLGNIKSQSDLTWNFDNSSSIIELGNTVTKLSDINIRKFDSASNANPITYSGLPSLTTLDMSNASVINKDFKLSNVFDTAPVSELREIDFSNTKCTNNGTFSLDLVLSNGDTKYRKLTKININNSQAISNLSIPKIPLQELIVQNSAITNFELVNQKYLNEVSLDGCNNLTTIVISGCDKYENINLSNLVNVRNVTITSNINLKTVTIDNLQSLQSIQIENCKNLETIKINNCDKLVSSGSNKLRITECSNLKTLDVSYCSLLQYIDISSESYKNITTFNASYTSLTKLKNVDGEPLNLYDWNALNDVNLGYNTSLKSVQFRNDKSNPVPFKHSFYGCNNLERVYGCCMLYVTSPNALFQNCKKFSIQGIRSSEDDILTWNGFNVLATNYVKTVWDVKPNATFDNTFQEGKKVTNFKLQNTSNVLNNLFNNTNITAFDVYYMLFILSQSQNQNCSIFYTFVSSNTIDAFDWAKGRVFSVNMFKGCKNLTSFGDQSIRVINNNIMFLPTGIFEPLENLNSIIQNGINYVCYNDIFKRTDNKTYPIIKFTYFYIQNIIQADDKSINAELYENYSNSDWIKTNKLKFGDFTGVFESLPNLQTIDASFSCQFIDYSTIKFGNNKNLSSINNVFKCSYGKGNIDLHTMFPLTNYSNFRYLIMSFRCNGVDTDYGDKPTISFDNSSFNMMPNVYKLGGSINNDYGQSKLTYSFEGFDKSINGNFPVAIFSNLHKLEQCIGIFSNIDYTGNSFDFPGNMFINCPNLTAITGLFDKANFPIKLTSDGFKNCTKLKDVSYLFRTNLSVTERSKMITSIPYHFFYHGSKKVTNETIYGTNQTEKPDENYNLDELLTAKKSYEIVNNNITNMEYCFSGCINLQEYVRESTTLPILNPDYCPFKWEYKNNSWIETSDENKKPYIGYWGFDGNNIYTDGTTYTEENTVYYDNDVELAQSSTNNFVPTLNYICAPDLFRYCQSNAIIAYIFSSNGLSYAGNASGANATSESELYTIGMKGRIPEYLLLPISNIYNLSYMFYNCKTISPVIKNGVTYLIPKNFFSYAPNITNLSKTFSGMMIDYNVNLNIFSTLLKSIDVRGIFSSCKYLKKDTSKNTIRGIFNTNKISACSGAFTPYDITLNSNIYGIDFNSRIYYISNSTSNVIFRDNFNKGLLQTNKYNRVYYGCSDAQDSAINSSPNNYK